jgi:hypothetical protein
MNIRLQKYKKNRLAGMNQYNAARAAGYSEEYSKQACRVEKLVKVSLADEFERQGFTDKFMVDYAMNALDAMHLVGEDWTARHKFFETILKLCGKLSQNQNSIAINNVIQNKVGSNGSFDGEDRQFSDRIVGNLREKLEK